LTLDGSTVGIDPAAALDDINLRLFDSDGTAVASDNNGGPGTDSSITFTIPVTYDGSGYFVGVSGWPNGFYNPAISGSGNGNPNNSGAYVLRGSFDTLFAVDGSNNEGIITLNNSISVNEEQLVTFSLTPGQIVTTTYITVDDASQVGVGTRVSGGAGVPNETTVLAVDLGTNTLQLSQPIQISQSDVANIGFLGNIITVDDASTLADGMQVAGNGVPAGSQIAVGGIAGNDITLTQTVLVILT